MKELLYPFMFIICFILISVAAALRFRLLFHLKRVRYKGPAKCNNPPLTESQKRYIANICAVYILRQRAISIHSVKCITKKEQAEIISYLLIAASNIQKGAPNLKSIDKIVEHVRENIKY